MDFRVDRYGDWVFPKTILHPDDMARFGVKEYAHFNKYYQLKYAMASQIKPKTIVEIGVRAGYSAYAFLQACPEAIYYGFDNNAGLDGGCKGLRYYDWACKLLDSYKVTIVNDLDSQSVTRLPIDFAPYLMHIDGSHSFEGCMHDLNLAKSHKAAFILVDDVDYIDTVEEAVDVFLKENTDLKHLYIGDFRGQCLMWR